VTLGSCLVLHVDQHEGGLVIQKPHPRQDVHLVPLATEDIRVELLVEVQDAVQRDPGRELRREQRQEVVEECGEQLLEQTIVVDHAVLPP
jgi:hypothetical protein